MARSSTTLKKGDPAPTGGGRPRGSKSIYSKDSVKKLEELGYDPIEEMIKLQDKIEDMINAEKAKSRPSTVAIAQWINTQQKITADLMRYGYGRTPEPTENTLGDAKTPLMIKLT